MNCEVYKPGSESSLNISSKLGNVAVAAAKISAAVTDVAMKSLQDTNSYINFSDAVAATIATQGVVDGFSSLIGKDTFVGQKYMLETNNMNGNYTTKAYTELNDLAGLEKKLYFNTLVTGYKKKCDFNFNTTITCNSNLNVRSCNVNMNNYTNLDSINCFKNSERKKKCFDAQVSCSLGTPLYVSSGTNKDTNIPIVCELGLCISLFGFNIPVFIDKLNNIDGNEIDGWVCGISPQSITATGKTTLIPIETNRCCG